MSGIAILGGIGLILFGIRFLRKGLDRLFGGRLIGWLSRLTANPAKALGVGIVAGAVSPSSTSISIMAAQLLRDGKIRVDGVLAMLLGANVGMTILVQFMAVRIQDYAGLMIITGVGAFLYTRREVLRGAGQLMLALGFIFLAIQMIGAGAAGIAGSGEAQQLFALLHGHPLLIFLGTMLLVVVLQSSTATVGLGVGLCASGLLGGSELVPWVLGTNVGVGVSSLIVGWSHADSRRLGVANLLTKSVFAFPLLIFPLFAERLFYALPGDVAQQTIFYHTLFNLAVGALALPLLAQVVKLSEWFVPQAEATEGAAASHLDVKALDSPPMALAKATREVLAMADGVRQQLEAFWRACRWGDVRLARQVQRNDDVVDRFNHEIIDYLSRITGERSQRDNRWQIALMNFTVELESIGDLLDKHLCDLVAKQRVEGALIGRDDWSDLDVIYQRLLGRFDRVVSLLARYDSDVMTVFAEEKRDFNEDCWKLQQLHYDRLRSDPGASVIDNTYFIDYLNGLRGIHHHLSGMGHSLVSAARECD